MLLSKESKSHVYETRRKYITLSHLIRFLMVHTPPHELKRQNKEHYLPLAIVMTLDEIVKVNPESFYDSTTGSEQSALFRISGSILKALEVFDLGCKMENELLPRAINYSVRVWEVYKTPDFIHWEKEDFRQALDKALIKNYATIPQHR